jgi:hypothetical protein
MGREGHEDPCQQHQRRDLSFSIGAAELAAALLSTRLSKS